MARIDYSLLVIEKLIIHNIPKHRKGETDGSPNYSEDVSTMTDGLRALFQDKIKQALNLDQAFSICFKEETESIVPQKANLILRSDEDFIINSQAIALNLYTVQQGNNAAGILLVIKGRINNNPVCVILKLEPDNGAQLVRNESTRTYDVEEVSNLMLTNKTKVFKVALLLDGSVFNVDYDGKLMDFQINVKTKKNISTFFLDFLGCKPYSDPKISTKEFYNLTREFIDILPDPLARSKYIQDLNSYLMKNQQTISPRQFADEYMLDTEHKNSYKTFLESKSFEFTTYHKDNSLINNHISKILMEFENGISLLGTKGTFEDKVSFTNDEQTGECTAQIKSKIKKIK